MIETSAISRKAHIAVGVEMGHYCVIEDHAVIDIGSMIDHFVRVGVKCFIGRNVTLKEGVILANETVIKPGAFLGPHVVTLRNQITAICGVEIGERAFIGAGAIILPDVKIASDVVIGAGSVVTQSIDYGVWCGVPARPMERVKYGTDGL